MGSDILKGMIALANKLVPLKEEEECNSLKILGDFMGINETNRSEIMKVAGFTEMLIEKFDKIDIFKAEKEEMLINLMKILWQVTCEDKSFMEKLFPEDNAMIQKMFTLVTHHNFKVFNPAVQLFRKLSAGTDEQTKRVLKLGIIHRLPLVLVKPGADIFSILILLGNLATLKKGVQEITNFGPLQFVADYAKEGNGEDKLKRECVYLLSNMVLTGSHDDHDAMIGKGIFSILDDLQHVYHVNAKITGEIQNTLERLRMPRNHR